jgi:hypothetical protein
VSAIAVAASRDGRFAFVSLEARAEVAVFDLQRALTRGFGPGDCLGAPLPGARRHQQPRCRQRWRRTGGQAALAGLLPAGMFPREMALEPDGRVLLVTNFGSQQVEVVQVSGLP